MWIWHNSIRGWKSIKIKRIKENTKNVHKLDSLYKVYYRLVGDKNHKDITESYITVTINKAVLSYTASGYTGV